MNASNRLWIVVAAGMGALSVALGAFGAHLVPSVLEASEHPPEDIVRRLGLWETASRYHMYVALTLLGLSVARARWPSTIWIAAAWLSLVGAVFFSGPLYILTLAGAEFQVLGAVVPLGGLAMIVGWGAIGVGAIVFNRSGEE